MLHSTLTAVAIGGTRWLLRLKLCVCLMIRGVLERLAGCSTANLRDCIGTWISHWNNHPEPFVRTGTADQIIENCHLRKSHPQPNHQIGDTPLEQIEVDYQQCSFAEVGDHDRGRRNRAATDGQAAGRHEPIVCCGQRRYRSVRRYGSDGVFRSALKPRRIHRPQWESQ